VAAAVIAVAGLWNLNRIVQNAIVVPVVADSCAFCPPYASFYVSLCASGDDIRADHT